MAGDCHKRHPQEPQNRTRPGPAGHESRQRGGRRAGRRGHFPTQYYRLKGRYLAGGLAQALEERPRSGQPPKVTPALEARITSLACSDLPAGAARWTLSLLNETLVCLDYGPAVSKETIRQVLKKASSNPG
ncbi:helix-turn-helix domain-containing protein [Hymenobacter nivis]|uniref:Helix-turn-helix domain-containing protein n=1 Tax=Hymenobacter nivis TaxID=1850093 RepID=A0A2Z3GQC1_9BACT|nr:hypothetical protein DDQ68_18730 [Hymenobacter nivis]